MHEWLMSVLVRVRLATIPVEGVVMPMVSIVTVRMSMRQSCVSVLVLMHFSEV